MPLKGRRSGVPPKPLYVYIYTVTFLSLSVSLYLPRFQTLSFSITFPADLSHVPIFLFAGFGQTRNASLPTVDLHCSRGRGLASLDPPPLSFLPFSYFHLSF